MEQHIVRCPKCGSEALYHYGKTHNGNMSDTSINNKKIRDDIKERIQSWIKEIIPVEEQ